MYHNLVDMLGDPKFPSKAMTSERGLQIRYFQHLYTVYSQLDFTHIQDCPIAIEGIDNRFRVA